MHFWGFRVPGLCSRPGRDDLRGVIDDFVALKRSDL